MAKKVNFKEKRNSGTVKQFQKFVENRIKLHQAGVLKTPPAVILGTTGIGKSQIIVDVCKKYGYETITYMLTQINHDEVRGLQHISEGTYFDGSPIKITSYSLPDIFRIKNYSPDKKYVIFLDEITNANEFVTTACYELLLERRIGDFVLPDNIFIIAGGNLEDDASITNELHAPIKTRVTQFLYKGPTFDEYKTFMDSNKFNKTLNAFLSEDQNRDIHNKLSKMSPEEKTEYMSSNETLTTPRTLKFLSDTLNCVYGDELSELFKNLSEAQTTQLMNELSIEVSALVDEDDAEKFILFLKELVKLPSVEDIVKDPLRAFNNLSQDFTTGIHTRFNYYCSIKYTYYLKLNDNERYFGLNKKFPQGLEVYCSLIEFFRLFKNKEILQFMESSLKNSIVKSYEENEKKYDDKQNQNQPTKEAENLRQITSALEKANLLKDYGTQAMIDIQKSSH